MTNGWDASGRRRTAFAAANEASRKRKLLQSTTKKLVAETALLPCEVVSFLAAELFSAKKSALRTIGKESRRNAESRFSAASNRKASRFSNALLAKGVLVVLPPDPGHSSTHHSLQTPPSKVKMATIIAQQLSAGCVPFRDAPSPRARRGASRAAFPRPSTGPVCHRCACSALAAAREAGARASGSSRPSAAARARIDRRSEHGPAAPTDRASRTIRD